MASPFWPLPTGESSGLVTLSGWDSKSKDSLIGFLFVPDPSSFPIPRESSPLSAAFKGLPTMSSNTANLFVIMISHPTRLVGS